MLPGVNYSQIDPRTLTAIGQGSSVLGAGLGGYATGLANPESHHSGPGALVQAGLAAVPSVVIGSPQSAALSAALGYIAYRTGHGMGRQAATNYMLGPGYNANTINWQRLPGT